MKTAAQRLLLGFGIYAALLWLSNALDSDTYSLGVRMFLALLPMVGMGYVCWAVLTGLRHLDELQRRVQLEAIGMAFTATALITFAWGFAETAGLPHLPTFAVWPLMASLWALSLVLIQRRYQ